MAGFDLLDEKWAMFKTSSSLKRFLAITKNLKSRRIIQKLLLSYKGAGHRTYGKHLLLVI